MNGDPTHLALTPNDILTLRSNEGFQGPVNLRGSYLHGWKQANYLAKVFWRRWLREYLPALQTRQKWLAKTRPFKVGDVVMIADERAHFSAWSLEVVTETIKSTDGMIRTVKVKTANGVLIRDIRSINLLESKGGGADDSEAQ